MAAHEGAWGRLRLHADFYINKQVSFVCRHLKHSTCKGYRVCTAMASPEEEQLHADYYIKKQVRMGAV